MKILSQLSALLILVAVFTASCKKDAYNQPNAACRLTHSEDDLFGYSFDIAYNSAGNPSSFNFAGFPVTIEYDNRGRLSKANYGTAGVRFEFIYSNPTFLPTIRNYIRPDFGGLIGKDSFSFNILGQRIKMVRRNFLSGETFVYRYQYDNRANLTRITISNIVNGIETSPIPRFEALRYDNKINSLSGNQWLKYILELTEFDEYTFLQFSVNNALDWKWYYGTDAFKVTSSMIYNSQGFANTRNGILFDTDGITELASFTQANTSSCDEPLRINNKSPFDFKNKLSQKGNFINLPFTNKIK